MYHKEKEKAIRRLAENVLLAYIFQRLVFIISKELLYPNNKKSNVSIKK